jgi:predicted O-linked N-acetylglucosamine transferase (SPINDLY family)
MLARLAPLQMILLEPNWMDGTKNLDYYISWKDAEPKNPQALYKNKVAFLKHPPYWIDKPAHLNLKHSESELNQFRKETLNISPNRKVYLCANTPPKIHPKMDAAFLGILKKDRLATLVFLRSEYPPVDTIRERLKSKLGRYYERVIFLPTLNQKDAHLLMQSADCCLDSFPICGMSSSFDASILGVPLVTLPHKNSFGSWTAAIYKHIGIKGLTAKSINDYVNIAIKLSSDKIWKKKISEEIKNKASVFIESKPAAEEFQNFIIKAWERKKGGLAAQSWVSKTNN